MSTRASSLPASWIGAGSWSVRSASGAIDSPSRFSSRSRSAAPSPHFALEACGGFLWVFDLLVGRYGRSRVHLAQPRRIQMIANSTRKNDRNDAFWLAYLTFEGRLPEAHVPGSIHCGLRIAGRERIHAVQSRADAIRRLRSHMRQMGERLPTISFDTKAERTFVEDLVLRTQGTRDSALRESQAEIDHFAATVARWEEEIDELCEDLPEVKTLREEIPGVGRILAATIIAETGDPRRFRSPKAFGRFTGLRPSERSAGGEQIHGGITREGSPHLRWALIQAVMHCMRSKEGAALAVGDWTRARAKRLGKRKARAAAARKLAESIWRLFRHGEAFDAAKPFGGRALHHPALRAGMGPEWSRWASAN